MVKGVIYILVLFSILAWTVFISKLMQFYFMKKNLDLSIQKIKELKNLNELDQIKDFAGILSLEIQDELEKSEYKNDHIKERIELRLQNTISKQITASKNGLSLLASIGASAPFIGLFWNSFFLGGGIMNAFIGIANLGNASLAVVAPGIAEALFATAFGLVAAIPAVLFYNYLTRKNLKLMHHLDGLQILSIYFFIGVILMIKTEMAPKEEELSEINITPFIDIMLVLLAVTPLITSSIKIELPKSSQQVEDKLKNPIILYLNTDNILEIKPRKSFKCFRYKNQRQ